MRSISRRMRWAAATLALFMLTVALITPKASCFTVAAAEATEGAVDDKVKQVVESVDAEEKEVVANAVATGSEEEVEDDEPLVPGTVEILTDENFERVTQVATGATTGDWFIKFYAPWCGHCKKMEPLWNEVAAKLGGQVNIGKVDATKEKGLRNRFGVKSFPTLLLFSHGDVYKFRGGRKLDILMNYAKGGFKKDEKIEVPKPRNISGGVKELLAQLVKDMKGVVEGKMPQPLSIVMVLFVTLLVAVLATAGMSQPATGTRRKVE